MWGNGPDQYLLREAIEDVDLFVQPLRALDHALLEPVGNTPLDVGLEHSETDPVQRGLRRGELLQDLDAKARFLHHPPDAPNLSLDAVQAGHQCLLLSAVQHAA